MWTGRIIFISTSTLGLELRFPRSSKRRCSCATALNALKMPSYAKTSGSKGIHVYVPIRRGPVQKDVWTFTKALALTLAERYPEILTAQYRVAKRPRGRVLVDYNQNAWGRTLASVYSVRPTPAASISTPLTWAEVERGVEPQQFTMEVVLRRVARDGDLFAPVLSGKLKLPHEAVGAAR